MITALAGGVGAARFLAGLVDVVDPTTVTVVVNNNSGFGQNLTGVRRISGNRPGRGEELIRFGPTDFTEVAKSFGVRGIRVEQPQDLAPALQQALAADEPVLVDVVTDLEPRAPEAWSPPRSQG